MEHRTKNWYSVSKHMPNYLAEQSISNGLILRNQVFKTHSSLSDTGCYHPRIKEWNTDSLSVKESFAINFNRTSLFFPCWWEEMKVFHKFFVWVMKPLAESWVFHSCKNSIIFIIGSKNTLVSNFRYLNLKNIGHHVCVSVVGTNSLAFSKCFYWMVEWQQHKITKVYYPYE